MGLDQYAKVKKPGKNTDEELFYWRKHPNLHGWMEGLYRDKGGDKDEFNCERVYLTKEDLEALRDDIENDALPPTEGFFFGQSDGSETQDDLKFVQLALEQIQMGNKVYYTSWW